MDRPRTPLAVLLWFVALAHLVIGLGGFISQDFQEQVARLYGAGIALTPEMSYVIRMLAAFMIGLGVAGVAAARDPLRYRGLVIGFAVIFLLRALQRLLFLGSIESMFAIPAWRTVWNAVFFAALGVVLLALLFRQARGGAGEGGMEPGAA